jgi:metallo-beta-lactamase family protein
VGTLARSLVEGATRVRLFGAEVPVRARIHTINGFSAHADQAELLAWHGETGTPETTFLVHGEPQAMASFGAHLEGTRVETPVFGDVRSL